MLTYQTSNQYYQYMYYSTKTSLILRLPTIILNSSCPTVSICVSIVPYRFDMCEQRALHYLSMCGHRALHSLDTYELRMWLVKALCLLFFSAHARDICVFYLKRVFKSFKAASVQRLKPILQWSLTFVTFVYVEMNYLVN